MLKTETSVEDRIKQVISEPGFDSYHRLQMAWMLSEAFDSKVDSHRALYVGVTSWQQPLDADFWASQRPEVYIEREDRAIINKLLEDYELAVMGLRDSKDFEYRAEKLKPVADKLLPWHLKYLKKFPPEFK